MNENEQRMMDEQGITLKEFLWSLLEQWRGLLVTALVFALLLAGAKYSLNARANRAAQKAEKDPGAYILEERYAKEPGVTTAIRYYTRWQDVKKAYANNPLMTVDPTAEARFIMRFYITADDPAGTDLDTIEDAYRLMTSDQDFPGAMAGLFDREIPAQYIRDAFLCNSMSDLQPVNSIGRGFSVIMVLVPRQGEYDLDQIRSTVTAYVEKKKEKLQKTLGDFRVTLLYDDYTVIDYPDRAEQQSQAFAKILTAETAFQTQYDTLSSADKAAVDKLIGEGDYRTWLSDHRDPSVDARSEIKEETKEVKKTTGFPKKSAVLGFLCGLILYAGLLFLRMVFSRRFRDEDEIGRMTGLRSFGGIYSYPYTSFPGSFLHSRRVYRARRKNAAKPAAQAGKIARKVAAKAGHMQAAKVSMIVLGDPSEGIRTLLRQQTDLLQKEGIPAGIITADKGVSSIDEEKYTDMGSVLIVALSGTTTPRMVASLMARLNEYQIQVLGTEFVEGA